MPRADAAAPGGASRLHALLLAWLAAPLSLAVAQEGARGERPDPAQAFFAAGEIVRIELVLGSGEREQLRREPRKYVRGSVRLDGATPWADVGIKLKGAAGSFRAIDAGPGFTINLGKFGGTARLHGLRRFHLNNGAQDDSRLCEWLGHEVFAAAGRPAPRVAHARVWLDGEDLGLYVLREAFDEQFLLRVFGATTGSLYDGGFCQDIDVDLEKDAGDGPDDHADLQRLLQACREFDPERAASFAQRVDVDALVDFCALEAMLGHWDGYSYNRNNFRLWLPATGGAVFLPHGMDQIVEEADAGILAQPTAIAASALMQQPQWRKQYRDRLRALLPLFAPQRLEARLENVAARIEKELRRSAPDLARQHAQAAKALVARVNARYRFLRDEVRAPEPQPLQFGTGRALVLRTWRPAAKTDGVEVAKKSYRGVAALLIGSRDRDAELVHGLWRAKVLLARGRYRLSAKARCDAVSPRAAQGDRAASGGAFLAVDDERSAVLRGDANWQVLDCEFEVGEFQRDVELRLELSARQGQVWFRLDSLRIERLP